MTFGDQLRALRVERGLTLRQLAGRAHFNAGYLSNVENGRKPPSEDLARAVDAALSARGDLIAAARLDVFARREADPWETAELIRRMQSSDVSESTLDALKSTVVDLCCQYSHADAVDLRAESQGWLGRVGALLREPMSGPQHTELLVLAGWLGLLIGCIEYDLGMRAGAEATRVATRGLGHESGNTEIIAWSHEMAAWFALTQGRYKDVVIAAQAGQDAARGKPVAVQLVAQEAKARARMGDARGVVDTLDRGRRLLDRMPAPDRIQNHFEVDPAKWDFYCMDAFRLLGDDERAEEQARMAIAGLTGADGATRSPMRIAEAQLTLGVVAARRGDLDAATGVGLDALAVPRRSLPSLLNVAGELGSELHARFPKEPAAHEFHDAVRSLKG